MLQDDGKVARAGSITGVSSASFLPALLISSAVIPGVGHGDPVFACFSDEERTLPLYAVPDGVPIDQLHAWHGVAAAIRSEDVEDGRHHPAELVLCDFLKRFGDAGLVPLLQKEVVAHPEDFAAILRLVGRTPLLGPGVRSHLVMSGLQSAVVDVRDASMQAVESWGDPTLVPLLQRHVESDEWLADYQRRIIEDVVG